MNSNQVPPASTRTPQVSHSQSLRRVIEVMARGTDIFTIALFLLLLAVVFAMILARSVFNVGLVWLDDLARYLQIWVVYAAAVSITMKGEHIAMDAVYIRMSASWRLLARRLTGMFSLIFCAITGYLALLQALDVVGLGEVSASGVLPAVIGYASLPFGLGLAAVAGLYYFLYRAHQDKGAPETLDPEFPS